jgi:hypothetical protein
VEKKGQGAAGNFWFNVTVQAQAQASPELGSFRRFACSSTERNETDE